MLVASVDVAIDEVTCDLLNRDRQDKWIAFVKTGRASGLTIGPPCETWSVARFARGQDTNKSQAPRPVRSSEMPWGLPDLTAREHRQVEVGNELLCFAVEITIHQALAGNFSVLEHPQAADHFRDDASAFPSIWKLGVTQWLRELDLFTELHTMQGHFGGHSVKPTTLLVGGITANEASTIEQSSRTTPLPLKGCIGKDEHEWRTSKLKTYPRDFCTMISHLFHCWISHRWESEDDSEIPFLGPQAGSQ